MEEVCVLFHYVILSGSYDVALCMSFDAFTCYMQQTCCNVDYDVELCNSNTASIEIICQHCKANSEGICCIQPHSGCYPWLFLIIPELRDKVNRDIMTSVGCFSFAADSMYYLSESCSYDTDNLCQCFAKVEMLTMKMFTVK